MDHDDGSFGEEIAARYDDSDYPEFRPEVISATVDFLVPLAGGRRALEFAIGTGRIALPLAERGVKVHGIDMSRPMVARLRAKPGGEQIGVTIGDMATTRVDGLFRLVYVVYNSIMNLGSQAAQVACFRNAAAHLESGGKFVVEIMIPELRRLPHGETTLVFDHTGEHFGFDEYDVAEQSLTSHHFDRAGDGYRYTPFFGRYAWPSELDLMAGLAGMVLRERWADWRREPFTSESRKHVSVWEKP
jgi:SAM-dependent methyltransferase